jgi:hypothetical protein
LVACSSRPAPPGPPAQRSFYYWRTTFQLSADERDALATLGVTRLYVRAFDVTWTGDAPEMVGKIVAVGDARVPQGVDVVPVVFLRDEVFRRLPADAAERLAVDVWGEATRRVQALGAAPPREVQLDCDWTDRSRDTYFAFARRVGELAAAGAAQVSATIRLHQVKFRERTGVPPVARGMLMFYNMGRFTADADARAIFDPAAAARYLARVHDYPLPLDVALPVWSWTLQVRDDRVQNLLQSTDPDELATLPFVARDAAGRWVATRTTYLHGALLRAGDVLKPEVTGPAEAAAAARLIAPVLAASPRTVALFDLSERNVKRHGVDSFDALYRAVR